MITKWIKVYDLSHDDELVAKVQEATLNTTDYGLVPEVALYGSTEWWEAISNGLIQKHVVEGVITNVFSSGESDWPQFEVKLIIAADKEKKEAYANLVSRGLAGSSLNESMLGAIERDASNELNQAMREYNRAMEEIALLERKVLEQMNTWWQRLFRCLSLRR